MTTIESSQGEMKGIVLPEFHVERWVDESGEEWSIVPTGNGGVEMKTGLLGCHPSVYLGLSGIHGRGSFVKEPVPLNQLNSALPSKDCRKNGQGKECLATIEKVGRVW